MSSLSSFSIQEKLYNDIYSTMTKIEQTRFEVWARNKEVADMVRVAKSLFSMNAEEENTFVNILYASSPMDRFGRKMIRDYFYSTQSDDYPTDDPSPLEILEQYSRRNNYPFFVHSAFFGCLFDKLMGYRNEDEPSILPTAQETEEDLIQQQIEESLNESLPSLNV